MNLRFDGKTAFVTGTGHGFGLAIAKELAALGATVYASDIAGDGWEDLPLKPGNVITTLVDVRDPSAVERWIQDGLRDTGRADIVVNNAGGVLGQVGQPIENVSLEEWRAIFEVNLDG
ncbi:MAG TPA: SDR family NAD(P)-dependent oxidoreductase, partial [Trueperaceae bacterium]